MAGAELAPVLPLRVPAAVEDELSRLRQVVELPRLIEAGYDPVAYVIRPPADHPVLGYELCPVAGCMAARVAGRLCYGCRQRFRRFDGTFDELITIPRVSALSRRGQQRLCIVCCTPGHERPAAGRNGLCLSCDSGRRTRGQTVAEYVGGAVPRCSYGRCARCERWAAFNAPRLCTACRSHWIWLGKPALEEFAAIPLRRSRAASRGIEVDLSELCERLRLEILYAFQHTWLDGGYVWEGTRRLQSLIDALARVDAQSLLERGSLGGQMVAVLYRRLRGAVERLLADPQRELAQDVWRLGMLRPDAGGQTVDYTAITQPWLRELVKGWNQQRLVSHSISLLRLDAQVGIELSNVLRLRSDGGDDPRALGRQDVVDFLVRLRGRQLRGEITNTHQRNCVTRVRAMLRDARERGLHRQPGPLTGLAEQRVRDDGRLESLPVFVYRPEKRPKTRKELPIFAEERRLIGRMQALARERFPDADPGRLPLLPRHMRNRDGHKPLPPTTLAWTMREWVAGLAELTGPDGEPFDRKKVFPYAFRHSYAQRLADVGASESELMDLMDHDSFETTRGYFRIRAERRRRAAELGRKALFDNEGRRLMRGLEQLAEAERTRMALGSLAVPYGACVEPANVASMGGACKFMLKCLGCKHFRTDLSHLPALEAYERQLVAARERLLAEAEVDGLEGWARHAALPAQEEIDRVRYLIGRIREATEELAPAERSELQELLAAERTNRSAILERLPARHELNVLDVGATFDGVAG